MPLNVNINLLNDNMLCIYIFPNEMGKKRKKFGIWPSMPVVTFFNMKMKGMTRAGILD